MKNEIKMLEKMGEIKAEDIYNIRNSLLKYKSVKLSLNDKLGYLIISAKGVLPVALKISDYEDVINLINKYSANLVEAINQSYDILDNYIRIDEWRYNYDCVSDNYYIDIKIKNNYIRLYIKDYELYNIDYVVDKIVQEVCDRLIEIVKKR